MKRKSSPPSMYAESRVTRWQSRWSLSAFAAIRTAARATVCVFACWATISAQTKTSVLTYQYSNSRAGADGSELVLTPSTVNSNSFGKLFAQAVDGVVYAQPLYLPNVTIPGSGSHNVVYVATEHDSVYAFDADNNAGANGAPLWHVSFLGPGVTTVPYTDVGCKQITPEIGITGTPVIDPASGTLYVVAMTKETSGGSVSYVHRLHALDVTTGAERPNSPVAIQASYPGTGEGGSTLVFQPENYKERPGLLLLNGVVYAGFSSHCDVGTYHGWLMGYDSASLSQVAVYNTTPNANEASFWQGNAAPAADANGNIFIVSANGTFDYASGGPDLGESYIKLSSGSLSVLDYFTPFNYAALDAADLDTGSAGVALLGDEAGSAVHPHLMAGAGKEGRIYLLDRDNLGQWQPGSDSQIVQSLPGAIGALFGNPAYFNNTLYFCGAGDSLKAFGVANAQMSTNPTSASPDQFGYGCTPTISANGTSNGVVWATQVSGSLLAYNASNLAQELYTSNQNSSRDSLGAAVKFSPPMTVNGKVYAGTQNQLVVYGLLPQGGLAIASAASGTPGDIAPGALASLYGTNLATGISSATGFPLPATLAGASVTVNGVQAPILYASPTQINFQVPFEVPPGGAVIVESVNGSQTGSVNLPLFASAPGFFLGAQGNGAVVNQDGSINSPAQPAPAGSVISAYVTGLGAVSPAISSGLAASSSPLSVVSGVSATIGGVSANVLWAGLAPGFAGLYQVNIQLPPLPSGQSTLTVSLQGSNSNAVPISVQ